MTPSLPTFSIASAMILPIVASLFAEIVPTWAIMLPLTGLDSFLSSSTIASTAFSMPRFSAIGFAPAATFFTPSRKIAWASTVAVVVPSPAMSEVLLATSRTICAPMFSSGSFSSISLATVTPSLVIVGRAELLVEDDVAALGAERHLDRVGELVDAAQDRLARLLAVDNLFWPCVLSPAPLLALRRAWLATSMTPRTSSSRMIRYSSPSSLISLPGVLAEQDACRRP